MNRPDPPPGKKLLACPECDKTGQIHERAHRGNAYVGDTDARYVCYACGNTFDEPLVREPKESPIGRPNAGRPPEVDTELLERVRQATAPESL